jgi:thiosulfate dehydrogenase [quinone] large subunit
VTTASSTAATTTTTTGGTPARTEPRSWGFTLLGIVRILVGFSFLWAFVDKLFGLGFHTPREGSWLNGGSPTEGFLGGSISSGNPFTGFWEFWLQLNPFTDILFMAGLLGIGLALILGIGTRIAAVTGSLLFLLMWLAAFPLDANPIFDDHTTNAVLVIVLAALGAGDHVGLGLWWRKLVRGNKFLI